MQLEKARPPTIENLQNPILIWKEHMTTFVMKQASQRARESDIPVEEETSAVCGSRQRRRSELGNLLPLNGHTHLTADFKD